MFPCKKIPYHNETGGNYFRYPIVDIPLIDANPHNKLTDQQSTGNKEHKEHKLHPLSLARALENPFSAQHIVKYASDQKSKNVAHQVGEFELFNEENE
jgi:hypothetical protein